MKSKLFLFLFILAAELICAQTGFIPGYIVKLSGDTLKGSVAVKTDNLMAVECGFRIIGNDTTLKYKPDEIMAYGFVNGDQYTSKQIGAVPVFMKRLAKDKNVIWYANNNNDIHYYVEKSDGELSVIPYYKKTQVKNGETYIIHSNENFKLKNTFVNNESLMQKGQSELKAVNLEISGGTYIGEDISHYKTIYQLSALVNICNPKLYGDFYFRTGIQSMDLIHDQYDPFYRIPIQIEYFTNKEFLNPRIACGMNLYSFGMITPSFLFGINFRISKFCSLAINYDIDYFPFNIVNLPYNSAEIQSITTGLIIGL